MVQSPVALTPEDYITPFTTIRDTLRNPNLQSRFTPEQLLSVLTFHLNRLKTCWQPFSVPSSSSRQELKSSKVKIPHANVDFEVDEALRAVVLKLSQRTGIDEIEALLLAKGADSFVDIDQLTHWWREQSLAVPQIILELDQLSSLGLGEWSRIADQIREEVISDELKFIEGLFRAWGGLAQKQLEGNQRTDEPLFWAKHQLSLQNEVLDLLFRILSSRSSWPASIIEGLLKGTIMSGFGTAQANREIWRDEEYSEQLQSRLSSLTLTIALESLSLARVNESTAGVEREDDLEGTIFRSQNHITPITLFLIQISEELQPLLTNSENVDTAFYSSPISVICLGWAIVLNSLPQNLHPPQTGFDKPLYQVLAERALSPIGDLFGRLATILQGPLFVSGQAEDVVAGIFNADLLRRQPYKHLLIGLADLLHFEHVPDKSSLQRAWTLLFGRATPLASLTLCQDFWEVDDLIDNRRAILDKSTFPRQFDLPLLLSSLSGLSASQPVSQRDTIPRPSLAVFDYFSKLRSITLPLESIGGTRVTGKDEMGRLTVETMKSIILPGGATINSGAYGVFVGGDEDSKRYVRLSINPISGWQLLVEILRTIVGQRPVAHKDAFSPTGADFVYLSVEDLAIEDDAPTVLLSGLQLLRAVLHPTFDMGSTVLEQLSYGKEPSSVVVLNLVITALDAVRGPEASLEAIGIVLPAIEIIGSLLALQDAPAWTALRNSSFFGALGKKRSIAADLVHADVARGDHTITLAVLRLVNSIVASTTSTIQTDESVVKASLQLVFSAIWTQASGWRYRDAAKKYEVISDLCGIFNGILSHPLSQSQSSHGSGSGLSIGAQYLVNVFIESATTMTYRPIVDVLSQAIPLAFKLMNDHRPSDVALVVESLETTLSFLSTLLRIASVLSVPSQALPKSLLAIPIVTPSSEKMQLVDNLFDLAAHPSIPATTRLLVIRAIRTYLESTAADLQKPSLAALLRSANDSCSALSEIAHKGEDAEVRAAAWSLLGSIITTQPGCALACIGSSGETLSGPLEKAVVQVVEWDQIIADEPQLLSAVLGYCHSALLSPSSSKAAQHLRTHPDFWQSVFEISTRPIPSPPTFTLSMHSEDFALRIKSYAYAVQAKANATALLAAELANSIDEDENGPETKVQTLLLGLFRNNTSLAEAAVGASHNSCKPSLHDEEGRKLDRLGVRLTGLRSIFLPAEREYGREYLYDANPIVPNDEVGQATVNLALDMLNLNWSMLDADIALTKAFRSVSERISAWTEGDALAARASLRASVAVAEVLAEEERGGDVMLAIQAERLEILATLLETALDKDIDPDPALLSELCGSVRKLLENPTFPPMIGLRHPELPALHKPILRIVFLLLQGLPTAQATTISIDPTVEAISSFTLEAADVVLDALIRQSGTSSDSASISASVDLGAIVGVLCEVTRNPNTTLWLDKISEHNLISRSLEVITRARITNGLVSRPVTSVLFLHLALASNPLSAEKLAVSGILPAYADNAITVEAEQGKIESTSPVSSPYSTQGAWCGMLLVVKALLTSLPPTHVSSFARSDVIPFIRVCTPQLLKSLNWDGEVPLSKPFIDELQLSIDVFYGIAQAIGPNHNLLDDFSPPALNLLRSIRFALAHPHSLSRSFVPSTEEERSQLEKELEGLEKVDDPVLVDFKYPTVATRTVDLLSVARSVVLTLVILTRAWEVVANDDEAGEGVVLETEYEIRSANDDPVGILNDIHLTISSLSHLSPASRDPAVLSARSTLSQLQESTALLSTSQLLSRAATTASPHEREVSDDSMEIDVGAKRRVSLGSLGPADRSRHVLRELEGDLRGLLPDGEDGQRGLLVRLRRVLEEHFGVE